MTKKIFIIVTLILFTFSACARYKVRSAAESAALARDFNLCLRQGSEFMNKGDYLKAIEEFNKAVAIKSDSSKAYNLLGMAYFFQKNYKLAEEEFTKAMSLDPSYAQAYNNLGNTYFMKRQFDKAKDVFKKALSLSPELVSANYSLGTLLVFEGQVEEGSLYLFKGISLDPEYLEKHKTFVASISSPIFGYGEIYFTYAKLFASTGNIEKTVEYLKKAKEAGFRDWDRVMKEKEFEKIREEQRIKEFLSFK